MYTGTDRECMSNFLTDEGMQIQLTNLARNTINSN